MYSKCFTMIEMVVVIVIIATLAAVATPMYFNYVKSSRAGAAKMQIGIFEQCIFDYRVHMKKLPASLEDLVKNNSGSKRWKGPYLKGGVIPQDPWGNDYIYKKPGDHGEFDIISYGADGQPAARTRMPTSATGPSSRRSNPLRRNRYTLVELVIVTAILLVVLAVGTARLSAELLDGGPYQKAEQLRRIAALCRRQAAATAKPCARRVRSGEAAAVFREGATHVSAGTSHSAQRRGTSGAGRRAALLSGRRRGGNRVRFRA